MHVKLKNIGNGSAVLVDTFCFFIGNKITKRKERISSKRFSVVGQGEEIKYSVILRDHLFEAIKALNIGTEGPCSVLETAFDILIRYSVLYRNILGAAFLLKIDYIVAISEDVAKKISDWIATISSFENDFSREIARYNAVYQRNINEAFDIFSEIQNSFYLKCPKENLVIDLLPVEQLFVIKHLDQKELKSISERLYHGIPIGKVKEEQEQKQE
ncbi:MAG: hypothetical protein C4567_15820 [Deltaproteobacteria bacterium]|nr:MAG: hypothetical protein C4567_15820 [Deltaproteobacteria bacterium]